MKFSVKPTSVSWKLLPTKPCPRCDGKGGRVEQGYESRWNVVSYYFSRWVPCERCGGSGRVAAT